MRASNTPTRKPELGCTLPPKGGKWQRTSEHCFFRRAPLQSTSSLTAFLAFFLRYGNSLVQLDPAVERKLRNKIDLMVVPTVAILYLFCFIDRANIGEFSIPAQAATKKLIKALN